MSEIGAFEAKNTLSALLERVKKGEEITITLRGTPVAKLGPITPSTNPDKGRDAVRAMRELADSINAPKLGWEEIKKMRDEGRR